MLKLLKNILGSGDRSTQNEQAWRLALKDKPFTLSVVSRAKRYMENESKELTKLTGNVVKIDDNMNLEERISLSVEAIAFLVSTEALQRNGLRKVFLHVEPIPEYSRSVIAFATIVIFAITGVMKKEGIELKNDEISVRTTRQFFLMHAPEVIANQAMGGLRLFKTLASSSNSNTRKWIDTLSMLTYHYIIAEIDPSEKLKNLDYYQLFGQMLEGMIVSRK